jgi:hypothetical protein
MKNVFFGLLRRMFIFKVQMKRITIIQLKKCLLLLIMAGLLFGCKHKKVSLAGNSKVDLEDFTGSFDDVKLPYTITDSTFNRDEPDSTLISYKVFTQFVPDTVLGRYFGKGVSPDIYPLGKVKAGKKESYLFIKALAPKKERVYVICFDQANKFIAAKSLFTYDDDEQVHSMATLDSKYTLSITHQRKSPTGETIYKKDAFVFNDGGSFMLILTESNEAPSKNKAILNPIDTLPRKHKFSGDYVQDKSNFISVRDGKDAFHIVFFVHFEKDNGDCKGELKGEAKLISPTLAHYTENGDPCSVNFSFSLTKVSMRELEGCGNHRDIKCFFEGSFLKQKEVKKKAVKKRR